MSDKSQKILVTYALPYANGPLHIGHMVGFIQTDIWVRFQRLLGKTCHFVCGDDAHGTPIMLRAQKLNISPEELIQQIHALHSNDLKDFNIALDNFYTTHSEENQSLANEIYKRLQKRGDIVQKTIKQAYDPVQNMFLPDRYVKGECPKCSAKDQYGDSCEACGAIYSPLDLKNAVSVVSGSTPIEKESEHFFFCLENFQAFLEQWTHEGHLQPEITKKLEEWLTSGLHAWDISRDKPYFGFEIPDAPGKYFYVWLDAPIGYIASFKNLCKQKPAISFDEFWGKNSTAQLVHFIGKDIVYFHTLFWPAMLQGSEFRTPSNVVVHGFLTVNGQKMSKSRGTFINARTYLNHLNPEYLRYYFASKLGTGIDDLDFQTEDFVARINADLVGKLVNIASRTASFINKQFNNKLAATCSELELYQSFVGAGEQIKVYYEAKEYGRAVKEIMKLSDQANRFVDDKKPWILAKEPKNNLETQNVCSAGLNLFKVLMTYLKPILPTLSKKTEEFLNIELTWENRQTPLLDHTIQSFKPLLQRIELKEVIAMTEEAKESMEPSLEDPIKPTALSEDPIRDLINLEEFSKVDLRVAKVLHAEHVAEAHKLIKFSLDLGGEIRQVFSGIKEAYPEPTELIGKYVVVVANLTPRKMRFGVSEGMVLSAGPGGKDLWILEPNSNIAPGTRIK